MKCFFVWVSLFVSVFGAFAQSTTNIFDGGSENYYWPPFDPSANFGGLDVTVGKDRSGNNLKVFENTSVSNQNLFIGANSGSSNNVVTLTNSTWKLDKDLFVGDGGSANSLVVASEGSLSASNATVGAQAGADNNEVLVSGSDAEMDLSGQLSIGGLSNANNMVTVTNGGMLSVDSLVVASSNQFNLQRDGWLDIGLLDDDTMGADWWNDGGNVIVSRVLTNFTQLGGSDKFLGLNDATWNAGSQITLGGATNIVEIAHGSQVDSTGIVLNGRKNDVFVYGSNTVLSSFGSFEVGGVSNQFVLSDGASLYSTDANVGLLNSSNNTIIVDGASTVWSNSGNFAVGDGGLLNAVVITNNARLYSLNSTIGGALGESNAVIVTRGASWQLGGTALTVSGKDNLLSVYGGGRVFVGDAATNGNINTDGGLLVVASADSNAWLNVEGGKVESDQVAVGVEDFGAGHVIIKNEGTLSTEKIGIEDGSELVLDQGGTLEMRESFNVGLNNFDWKSGGHLRLTSGVLEGFEEKNVGGDYFTLFDGKNRTLSIDGGATWGVGNNHLAFGANAGADGNTLIITNGGSVYSADGYVGYHSDSNEVVITGTGSSWELDTLHIGADSNDVDNIMTITNRGTLTVKNIMIETNNTLVLAEDGLLDVSGDFEVKGHAGDFDWRSGTLNIYKKLTWDGDLDGTNQTLTLDGKTALWTGRSSSDLTVGLDGYGNSLQILNGAVVSNNQAWVGKNASASNNTVNVTGEDSLWYLENKLTIGNSAPTSRSNSVAVSSGGVVSTPDLEINGENYFYLNNDGRLEMRGNFDANTNGFVWGQGGTLYMTNGALSNLELTDGTNRVLEIDSDTVVGASSNTLYWGKEGSGNEMTVLGNGTVNTADAYIGDGINANGNKITLKAVDSLSTNWVSNAGLYVGNYGDNNSFAVESNVIALAKNVYIGAQESASGNNVTIAGINAALMVEEYLNVGYEGEKSWLKIQNSGLVANKEAVVGYWSSNNYVKVESGGRWLAGDLFIGSSYPDNKGPGSGSQTNSSRTTIKLTQGNYVEISDGGRVDVDNIEIVDGNTLRILSEGTFHINNSFDVSHTNNLLDEKMIWESGGNLSVAGTLLGMAVTNGVFNAATNSFAYLNKGRYLSLDGAGGLWDNERLVLGYDGTGNTRLTVTNGATVRQGEAFIGWDGTGGNKVYVLDGAKMVNSNNLYVGAYYKDEATKLSSSAAGNSLVVSNNAYVLVGEVTTNDLGSAGGIAVASTNNAELIVRGESTVFTDAELLVGLNGTTVGTVEVSDSSTLSAKELTINPNSVLRIQSGGTLAMTDDFDLLSYGTGLDWQQGGHLSVAGALSNNFTALDGGRELTITSSNGVWNLGTDELLIGANDEINVLNITAGAQVTNGNATIGQSAESRHNTVNVSGEDSLWNIQGELNIGQSGGYANSVSVSDRATVQVQQLTINPNNAFNINEGGTLRMDSTNSFDWLAYEKDGLNWNEGGQLSLRGPLVGMPETNLINGTAAYVDAERHLSFYSTNGLWDVGTNNMIVGFESGSALLTLEDGAKAKANDGFVGWGSGSGNAVVVRDAGSIWDLNGHLYVGAGLDANTGALKTMSSKQFLTVTNGGWVTVGGFNASSLSGGGIGVVGTNVIGNADVLAENGFYVGDTNGTDIGYVDLLSSGKLTTKNLDIRTNSTFSLAGELVMTGDLSFNQAGEFDWLDGGRLTMTNSVLSDLSSITGSNKVLNLENESSWNNGAFVLDGYNNKINVLSNSSVVSTSVQIGGADDGWNSINLSETNSWTISDDLIVGSVGSVSNTFAVNDYSTLRVSNDVSVLNKSIFNVDSTNSTVWIGGDLTVSNAYVVGDGEVSFDSSKVNIVDVIGSNSVVESGVVFDGGINTNYADIVKMTDWIFDVGNSETNQFVNFERLELLNSTVKGSGEVNAFGEIVIDGGYIIPDVVGVSSNVELYLKADLAVANTPTLKVGVTEIGRHGSDRLRVSDNMTNVSLHAEIDIANSLEGIANIEAVILNANGGGVENVFDASDTNAVKFTERYLLYTFGLTNISPYEVAVQAYRVDGADLSSMIAYGGLQGVRSTFDAMQNTVSTRTKQLRRNLVATAPTPRSSYRAESDDEEVDSALPTEDTGAFGPGDKNKIFGMNIWADYFSVVGDYDALGNSAGFDLYSYGTTFGLDRLVGENLVLGVNYTYGLSSASADNGDHADSETYWLGAYGEWFNEDGWFVDGLLAYGWSDYSTKRVAQDYQGSGSYDGTDFGWHIEGGKYMHINQWAFAPYAGLHYLNVSAEGFAEQEPVNSGQFSVDAMDARAVSTTMGMKIRNRFDTRWGRIQTAGYAEWSYDHKNDEVNSTLRDADNVFDTAIISPDASMFNTGLGVSWTADESYEIGIGYDAKLNDHYQEHRGSLMINVMF